MGFREVKPKTISDDSLLFEENQVPVSGEHATFTTPRLPKLNIKFSGKIVPVLVIIAGIILMWYGISSSVSFAMGYGQMPSIIFNWQMQNVVVMVGILCIWEAGKKILFG